MARVHAPRRANLVQFILWPRCYIPRMEASLQQRGGVQDYTTYNPDDGSFEVLGLERPWTAKLAHCSKARALLAVTAVAVAAVVYVVTDDTLCQKVVCAGGGGSSPSGTAPPQKLAEAGVQKCAGFSPASKCLAAADPAPAAPAAGSPRLPFWTAARPDGAKPLFGYEQLPGVTQVGVHVPQAAADGPDGLLGGLYNHAAMIAYYSGPKR